MRDEKLSNNFMRSEFACKGTNCCGGSAPIDPRLIDLLQAIRDAVDAPVIPTSGFRCRKHNSTTKDAHPESYHTLGMAADIRCPGMTARELYTVCLRVVDSIGYGYLICYDHKGIVHVDSRNY